jgi:transmembrane sensor
MTRQGAGSIEHVSHDVLQQAAEWYARLRDGKATARVRSEWQHWLQASAEHRAAWQSVQDISRGFESLRAMPDPRHAADKLCTATERLRARRRTLLGLAALAGSGLTGWLGWREGYLPAGVMAWTADHRTGTGEQREIALADGSRAWLNTASAIDVHFDARERRIRLVTGEVFVETSGDSERPFVVDTAQGRLRALGTRFDVRQEAGETLLAVYRGAVEIRTFAGGAVAVVPAGQQARFTQDRITAVQAADLAREAWIRGTLAAENIALREVIAELRRYRSGYLGVADEVADLKVFGNFPVQDTDRVLRMLAGALPVEIRQPMPWWTSLEPRRQP